MIHKNLKGQTMDNNKLCLARSLVFPSSYAIYQKYYYKNKQFGLKIKEDSVNILSFLHSLLFLCEKFLHFFF